MGKQELLSDYSGSSRVGGSNPDTPYNYNEPPETRMVSPVRHGGRFQLISGLSDECRPPEVDQPHYGGGTRATYDQPSIIEGPAGLSTTSLDIVPSPILRNEIETTAQVVNSINGTTVLEGHGALSTPPLDVVALSPVLRDALETPRVVNPSTNGKPKKERRSRRYQCLLPCLHNRIPVA